MNIFKKTFSSSAVLIAALLAASCNQSTGEQTGGSSVSTTDNTPVPSTRTVSGPNVSLSRSEQEVFEGETFTLDIMVNDFTTTEGGAVTLRYNPAVIHATSVNIDSSVWEFVNKDGFINNKEGSVSNIIFSSYQGVSGSARVATVEFTAVGKGTTGITIQESSQNPFASNGEKMAVSFITTNVVAN